MSSRCRWFMWTEMNICAGKEILYVDKLTTDQSSAQNLDHVSFLLEKGEILAITGLQDSGISALSSALCGESHVCSGTIFLEGKPIRYDSREKANHFGIYHITQNDAIISTLSVSENLNVLRRFSWKDFLIDRRRNLNTTRKLFAYYGIDGNPEGYPNSLTRGAQLKLSICRAILCDAKILVCQELGEGFSSEELISLERFLRQLCKEGISVILITPDARKALQFSDRLAVMRAGRICYYRQSEDATLEEILKCMVAEEANSTGRKGIPTGRYSVSLKDVRLREYKGKVITADLYGGTSLGIFWAHSSYGDFVSQLFGGQEEGTGVVTENGISDCFQDWQRKNRQHIYTLGIRFWERNINKYMTVAENLALRTYYRFSNRMGILNPRMLNLALTDFAESHGIDPTYLNCYPHHLPPELRNQLVLWSVLFSPPKLLVLDCPMYTMDEWIRCCFLSCLAELKVAGTAILWSDISEAPKYHCDRLITIDLDDNM